MENNERKNNSLTELMEASMSKIRDMVDSNTIIGEPIQTPDGVTREMPVALPAVGTVDRVIDLVPQVMDRVESFIDKKKAEKETY